MGNTAIVKDCPNFSTEVRDTKGRWLATLTRGTYTVVLAGPPRRFAEGKASVSHARWVRTYPKPYAGEVDQDWLERALGANKARVPDVLAIAMQYIRGATAVHEDGLQIAGDARYGPGTEKKRQEGADFNDYLGVTWTYPGEPVDRPEQKQFQCLDCSGYMRMVWGFRHHLPGAGYEDRVPLSVVPKADRKSIPRRAYEIYASAPGVITIPRGTAAIDFARLGVGDLVFFDADTKDGPQIDHVGMYLGRDVDRRYRFISSRKHRNGPTLGDYHGASLLDGRGLYARSFCAVRRI
jgi:cell wall-associated NlpC family hydrolase